MADIAAIAYLVVIGECIYIAVRFWQIPDGKARIALIANFVIWALYMALLGTAYVMGLFGVDDATRESVRVGTRCLTVVLAIALGYLVNAMRHRK